MCVYCAAANCGAGQALACPHLLGGKNTLIAAETGSGKTIAYLAPLLHNLTAAHDNAGRANTEGRQGSKEGPRLLVLAPNRTLCAQVETVANTIIRNGNLPLKCSSSNSNSHNSQNGDRTDKSDRKAANAVLVCTPRSLLPPNNTPPLRQLECVVLDEGDLLLRDGYVKDVARLLDITRVSALGTTLAVSLQYICVVSPV